MKLSEKLLHSSISVKFIYDQTLKGRDILSLKRTPYPRTK